MMRRLLVVGVCVTLSLWVAACAGTGGRNGANAVTRIDPPSKAATQPANFAGVHNVVTYADGLYSGSMPDGKAGFETLAGMGVKTIISVDGATPEVELARQYGIRYVHLPIGYDGITQERQLEIARAVKDLPGPIYIHCHHGKHRSAGAAGVAAVTLGKASVDETLAHMKVSGTAANYTGLFACVREATVVAPDVLAKASNAFPEKSRVSDFQGMMVEVDEAVEHLRDIEKAGWKTPADHPDLVPAAEAARLAELFRNAPQPKEKARTAEFASWMSAQAVNASEVEQLLLTAKPDPQRISDKLKVLAQACVQCHSKYRD